MERAAQSKDDEDFSSNSSMGCFLFPGAPSGFQLGMWIFSVLLTVGFGAVGLVIFCWLLLLLFCDIHKGNCTLCYSIKLSLAQPTGLFVCFSHFCFQSLGVGVGVMELPC